MVSPLILFRHEVFLSAEMENVFLLIIKCVVPCGYLNGMYFVSIKLAFMVFCKIIVLHSNNYDSCSFVRHEKHLRKKDFWKGMQNLPLPLLYNELLATVNIVVRDPIYQDKVSSGSFPFCLHIFMTSVIYKFLTSFFVYRYQLLF